MAIFGNSTTFLNLFGGNIPSSPNGTTLGDYALSPLTVSGEILINYLLNNGVSPSLTFSQLIYSEGYFNTITNAINTLNTVETSKDLIKTTNTYGDDLGKYFGVADGVNYGSSVSAYKVYTALLTQTGTTAPVATVLENTLGLNPTYNYDTTGSYYLEDLAGLFTPNKTAVFMQFKNGGPTFEIWVENVNQVYVGTDGQNNQLLNTFIEIRVYN